MYREKLKLYRELAVSWAADLKKQRIIASAPLSAAYWRSEEPVPFPERNTGSFQPVRVGDRWGENWQCAWFHIRGEVPEDWNGEIRARLQFGGEALVYDASGRALGALTDHSIFMPNYEREELPLEPGCREIDWYADAGANNYFGLLLDPRPGTVQPSRPSLGIVRRLELIEVDSEVEALAFDVEVALDLLRCYREESYRVRQILTALAEGYNHYRGDRRNAFGARALLAERIFRFPATQSMPCCRAVGHAHIDLAWLWPLRETVRKTARTFANQLALLERYPEYVFGASQPKLFVLLKEHDPALFARVKAAVLAGRIEPQGIFYVEPDCNLVGGEAMIRQILFGQRFWQREFGRRVETAWLPDVFGFNANLPQFMCGGGARSFVTIKLSLNNFTEFPHHLFRWRGIDGSEILAHYLPEQEYNSELRADRLAAAADRFIEADAAPGFLSLFGCGDGGGGPKAEHIERARRLHDLEGVPPVTLGSAESCLKQLEERSSLLDVWNGGLFLERHNGTYTTQAKIKRANRKLEYALAELEMLWSTRPLEEYPGEELNILWEKLLSNQFHDILPGSSIARVNAEALKVYDEIASGVAELTSRLLNRQPAGLSVFNPTARSGPFLLERGGRFAQVELAANELSALPETNFREPNWRTGGELVLENRFARYRFAPDAILVEAAAGGRPILNGTGHVFSLYYDHPANHDAWDLDPDYRLCRVGRAESAAPPEVRRCEFRDEIVFHLKVGESAIRVVASLEKENPELRFDLEVDWRECHRILRVEFPPAVSNGYAVCDIPNGFVRHECHFNEAAAMAKYEIPVQRYMAIANENGGVALFNDCKYGACVRGGSLDLALLRSPRYPDETADIGSHRMSYALYAFDDFNEMRLRAAAFNQPPRLLEAVFEELPVRVESSTVVLSACKKAEDSDAWVVRLVETSGTPGVAKLLLKDSAVKIFESNLLEDELALAGEELQLREFETRTVIVVPDPGEKR